MGDVQQLRPEQEEHQGSVRPEPDLGLVCQKAAEARLEGCWNALYYHEGEAEEGEPEPEDPSCGPFCGCNTCVIREVLDAAWDEIEAYIVRKTGSPAPDGSPAAD